MATLCKQGQLVDLAQHNDARRAYEESRRVTAGMSGPVVLFTQRGADPEVGYIRLDGKTVTGYVPNFGKGGKVFYAFSTSKHAKLAA